MLAKTHYSNKRCSHAKICPWGILCRVLTYTDQTRIHRVNTGFVFKPLETELLLCSVNIKVVPHTKHVTSALLRQPVNDVWGSSRCLVRWGEVTTDGQSVCLGIQYLCGTWDQVLLRVGMLLSEICGLVSVGRPLWREDGSVICSIISRTEPVTIPYCLMWDSPKLGGQVPPRNRVAQLYPRTLGSLFIVRTIRNKYISVTKTNRLMLLGRKSLFVVRTMRNTQVLVHSLGQNAEFLYVRNVHTRSRNPRTQP
jgi:hypothetical protein